MNEPSGEQIRNQITDKVATKIEQHARHRAMQDVKELEDSVERLFNKFELFDTRAPGREVLIETAASRLTQAFIDAISVRHAEALIQSVLKEIGD